MQPPPHAPYYYNPGGFAPRPPRPARLTVAAVVLAADAAVLFGLTLLILVHAATYEFEPLIELPLLVLLPACVWLSFLVPAVGLGKPWARLATSVTVPIQVLFFVMFIAVMAPAVIDPANPESSWTAMREWAFGLCIAGVPLALTAPLVLIGDDVRAYLQRPR
ncbi:hypothetical protein [Phytomonospora endophytica]|uniref:Uncharacterized protein n=1 Tax=Phytomonospora endophytica TaxID=714109 RepID=A0A841FAG6_9ACTN|nr:hypothetical protein [Phytomonospora endophytica]MBB6034251.1 hypothetical protein [Phytomonospora endophytica]